MAGLSDNVGMLFKIKADATDAIRDLNKVQGEVKGLGAAGMMASSGVASMINPLTLVATGVAALSAAAIAGVASIARLTVAASEFGSQLFDASTQTGLNAASLSALKTAADTSGSSLDKVAASVAKFNVLLGQAANDNPKAQKILKDYGITATDAGEALEQAFNAVYNATNKNVAAAELFKDKTGQMIPVVDAASGSLRKLAEDSKKLGIQFTDDDLRAADAFGDTLDILGKQAAAAGQKFAFELMPNATHAMQSMSSSAAENTDVFRDWGRYLGDIIRGVELSYLSVKGIAEQSISAMNSYLGTNISATQDWASIVIGQFGLVGQAIVRLRNVGAADPLAATAGARIGGQFGGSPDFGGGGGAGGGGGRGGGGAAAQDTSVADAQRRDANALALFKEAAKAQFDENDRKLAAMEISEREHLAEVYRLKVAELEQEKSLLLDQLNLAKLTAKEREQIEHRLDIIRTARHGKDVENRKEITELDMKALDDASEALDKLDRLAEEAHQRARKRRREANEERKRLDAIEQEDINRSRDEAARDRNFGKLSVLGDSVLSVRNDVGTLQGLISPIIPVLQMAGQMVEQFAQGVGNVVQNLVLMGTAGPNAMKKLVASVLAGVAAQAAVLAIMELAYGIAALTPWGAAIYGPAVPHFKAAALFGAVAVGTGLAGRAVAGDSFSQSTANGGAGANNTQGDGTAQRDPNTFTSGQFGGFGSNQNSGVIGRLNETLVVLEDTVHGLKTRIAAFSPGQVLGMGAEQNPNAISDSLLNGLSDNPRLTGGFKRAMGDAR